MSPIDINTIIRKIKLIEEDLSLLSSYKSITFSNYQKDVIKKLSIERLLERITGRMIDTNYHLLKEEYEYTPVDYHDSFVEIGKRNIITAKFAAEIAKSTGLRNALAHEYESIDDKKIYESIKITLTQVPKYLKIVIKFLKI